MFIHWSASLETGQKLIDAEHRLLVFLFRKLDVATKTGESQMAVNQIILEVRRFVEFHFTSEENVMRETQYPRLLAHQALHADLLAKLGVLSSRVMTQREFPEDMVFFLNSWLVEHIAHEDQLVAKHVSDASARPVAESAYGEYIVSAVSATSHT